MILLMILLMVLLLALADINPKAAILVIILIFCANLGDPSIFERTETYYKTLEKR